MNIVGEIRFYLGKDYAHLKFSETRDAFSIDTVLVPADHRGLGTGSLLVRHVLDMADAMGKEVLVSARPIGPVSPERLERLVRYYERFGFAVYDTGLTTAYMRRKKQGEEDSPRAPEEGG